MRIFLDANILFSAARSAGAIRRLLEMLFDAGHSCCIDGFVLEEARRNLAAKSPDGIEALDALLPRLEVAHRMVRQDEWRELPLPEKDRPVLAAAIQARCGALVTGDRTHFGDLFGRTIDGVTIHSPRSLAETLLG